MSYSLLYVEGISRVDTPYFDNLSSQTAFFSDSSIKVKEIMADFPPFYTNEVSLDSDDLRLSTKANYLKINYQNKNYYYFITDIRYKTEDTIILSIELDTIQTYMFDFKVDSGIIERKFIDRWLRDGSINRNYLRENVSRGEFKPTSLTRYSTFYGVIAKDHSFVGKNENNSITEYNGKTKFLKDGTSILFGWCYKYLPITSGVFVYDTNGNILGQVDNSYNISALSEPNIASLYAISSLPDGITYENFAYHIDLSKITPDYSIWAELPDKRRIKGFCLGIDNELFHVDNNKILSYTPRVEKRTYSFDFEQSTEPDNAYYSKYIPCMLDENYIRIEYGEKYSFSSFPLYCSSKVILNLYKEYNYDQGNRYYLISLEDITTLAESKYFTISDCASPNSIEMNTEYYKQWKAQNMATLASGILTTGLTIASIWVPALGIAAAGTSQVTKVLNDKASYTKKGALRVNANKRIDAIEQREGASYDEDASRSVIAGANFAVDYGTKVANLIYTPPVVKSQGQAYSNIFSESCVDMLRISKVDDFEQVAQYYHRTGNLVNEYVNNISNIFSYVHTRRWFNVLKLSDIDISFNLLQSEALTDSIKSRLIFGIRLWNIDPIHKIGVAYSLDNEELSI